MVAEMGMTTVSISLKVFRHHPVKLATVMLHTFVTEGVVREALERVIISSLSMMI